MNNSSLRVVKTTCHKPIIWSLFAAGGTISALLMPAIIFIFALAAPLGILPEKTLDYAHVQSLIDSLWIRIIIFAILFFSLWHAAHRLRITVHDFGLRADRYAALTFYCLAAAGSLLLALALF